MNSLTIIKSNGQFTIDSEGVAEIFKKYCDKEISYREFEVLMKREYDKNPASYYSSCNQLLEAQHAEAKRLYEKEGDIRKSQIKQIFGKMNPHTIKSIYAASQVYSLPLRSGVYFIKNECTGLTKIGQAENIERRFSQIKSAFVHVGMPANLKLTGLALVYPQWLNKVERDFHRDFRSLRTCGEWFNLSDDDIMGQLFYSSDSSELICDMPVNYDDWEYPHFSDVKKEYEVSIEELGYTKNLYGIPDPILFVLKANNKLLEIIKTVEKYEVGFYDITCDYKDFSKIHHRGIRYMDSDEWYSFQDVKTKAFNKSQWERTIKKINKIKSA